MDAQEVMHMTDYSKITALYSRLSVGDEDRDGGESNSIQNQKIFLENYARGQHLTNIRHYIDDDESGRFFDRSAYSRMMDDVENGKIGVCIMKDLTRWGRDYLQVGNTLYMNEGNQYYDRCRIEGLIDFIYSGDAARAVFNDCEIVFVYEETHPDGGYVCAPRTAADAQYGLIFNNCVITSEEGCEDGTFHLARPWGPDAFIYWINCYMGSAINTDEPYADMSGNAYTEARFYECGSYGPGYAVNADRRQISPAAAETLLANLGWNPEEALQSVNDSYVDPAVIDPGDPDNPGTEDPDNPGTEDPDKPGNENTPDNNNGNGSENGDQPKNDGTDNPSKDNENKADKQNTAEASRSAVATGDDTNLFIWPSLVILSGAAASITLVTRRKRN